MSEHDPGQAGPTAVEFDESRLDAKLSVPRLQPGSVSRAELIETARASDCRVVGVTAPAGYGKSTLLAQWALAEERPVAWVALDRFDDDPMALLTLLASAYARVSPGNSDLVADMRGLGLSVLGRTAPRLASAFRTSPVPFMLMLDDLHELRSPACQDVLGIVIAGIPRGSQFVAASRFEQPHLPRLRVSDDALELSADDLALDAAGAEQIFAASHVSLTRERALTVTRRTEGWPAGLHIAALIAHDGNGEGLTVSGDDRYVADYLYRELLVHLPENLARFLRCTAVLDQLCAPLCDALLGESGAQERLRRLESSNMFLIPLDRRREWYRYHALFREFLLAELRRVEPDVVMKLHLRAADWYEAHGSPAMAVEHLLNTTERSRCVELVTALVLPTYQAGQMSTVQRWLSALGTSAIEDYPPLAVLAGYMAVFTGQSTEAQRWAAIVDAASFDLVPADGTASFESARAMFRAVMCAAGPEQMLTDASLGVALEPPWSPWRDTALCFLGGGVSAHRRRRPGQRAVRGVVRAGDHHVEHRFVRRQRGRTRSPGDGSRAVGSGCRTRATGTRRGLRASDARLRHERARLRCRGPAGPAPGRREGEGPPAHVRDASPPGMHLRAAIPRSASTAATCQGVPRRRRRHDRSPAAEGDRRRSVPLPSAWRARRRSRGVSPGPHDKRAERERAAGRP